MKDIFPRPQKWIRAIFIAGVSCLFSAYGNDQFFAPASSGSTGGLSAATYIIPKPESLAQVQANFNVARARAGSVPLVFDGDSITYGWLESVPALWNAKYGSLGGVNFAIPADRTEHILWRLSLGQMEGLAPQLIVLLIGTNNLAINTDEQIVAGVQTVVNRYRELCPNATVLIQGLFPRGQFPNDPLRARITAINLALAAQADGQKILFLDCGPQFLQPDGSISPTMMADFLHLTPAGYQIWADALQPTISRLFPPYRAP